MDSCRFLEACIKESLRMSPSTGTSLWREVESDCLIVDGHAIPKGCDVGSCIYSLHHNENYFPDSYSYRPERWLPECLFQDKEVAMNAWMPFSAGSRICAGQELAMMELSDILALLIWHLDFRKVRDTSLAKIGEGEKGAKNGRHRVHEFQLHDHIAAQVQGPILEFRRRLG